MASSGHSPAVRRKRLGKMLRDMRNREGLTLEQLGALVGTDHTRLSRLENGRARAEVGEVMDILDVLSTSDAENEKTITLARAVREKGWWKSLTGPAFERQRQLIELESGAATMREVSNMVVPGLLQIEEYSQARFARAPKFKSEREREAAAKARIARQRLLEREDFRYEAILDESVLLRLTCQPDVMARQLEYLIDINRRPNIGIHIMPFSSPVHQETSLIGGFTLLEYRDEEDPAVVFVETETTDLVLDDDEDVNRYQRLYEVLFRASMSDDKVMQMISDRAERMRMLGDQK